MHPKLEPLIQSEVKKLLEPKIIFKVKHSEWVSNLVPVRKNSREIRLYVDFRNLNCASDKDNYLVPPMEQILQMVSGSELFSLLDGFSGYNQVFVVEKTGSRPLSKPSRELLRIGGCPLDLSMLEQCSRGIWI